MRLWANVFMTTVRPTECLPTTPSHPVNAPTYCEKQDARRWLAVVGVFSKEAAHNAGALRDAVRRSWCVGILAARMACCLA